MIYNFNEMNIDSYKNYTFEKITHVDALYVELKIMELDICKECKSIRDIQNIKTKCTEILNTLNKYKTDKDQKMSHNISSEEIEKE